MQRKINLSAMSDNEVDYKSIKAGDWVQIANGDWYQYGGEEDEVTVAISNEDCCYTVAGKSLLTRHRTAEEVETNGLPVSGNPDDLVSKAEVDRIVEDALYRLKAQVAKAVFDNDYMWDDLAELGINPELEKESNPDDRVSKADYWFQKYNAMKTAGVDDEEIRDMYDELRLNVAKAVFWQDAYATGLREKEDIRQRIVALGITPELLEKESNE